LYTYYQFAVGAKASTSTSLNPCKNCCSNQCGSIAWRGDTRRHYMSCLKTFNTD